MSAFMMPAKTTAIIAEYLAAAANCVGHSGTMEGVKTIEPPTGLLTCLKEAGCYNAKHDEYEAKKIYEMMNNFNISALKECYGDASEEVEPFEQQWIHIHEDSRRQWLSNLYTVARCYHYQICEGVVRDSKFYKAFGQWVNEMASELAAYVVKEVRPDFSAEAENGWKPWSEF